MSMATAFDKPDMIVCDVWPLKSKALICVVTDTKRHGGLHGTFKAKTRKENKTETILRQDQAVLLGALKAPPPPPLPPPPGLNSVNR